jgi:hypothetical protein
MDITQLSQKVVSNLRTSPQLLPGIFWSTDTDDHDACPSWFSTLSSPACQSIQRCVMHMPMPLTQKPGYSRPTFSIVAHVYAEREYNFSPRLNASQISDDPGANLARPWKRSLCRGTVPHFGYSRTCATRPCTTHGVRLYITRKGARIGCARGRG